MLPSQYCSNCGWPRTWPLSVSRICQSSRGTFRLSHFQFRKLPLKIYVPTTSPEGKLKKKTIDISRVSRLFPPSTFQSSFFSRFCLLLLFSTIYTIISPLILIQRFSINTPNISRPIPFFPLQTPSPLNLRHKPPF